MSRLRNSSPQAPRARTPATAVLLLLALGLAPAAAGQAVTGRVTATGIAAMDAVRVELRAMPSPFERVRTWAPGQEEAPPLATARPLPDGGFRLVAPGPGMVRVVVRAPGRVAMQRNLGPLLADVELAAVELPAAGATRVRVVGPGAVPIAGARLIVGWGRGAVWAREMAGWRPVREPVFTDASGWAAVPIAAGEEEVVIEGGAPGWWGGTVRGAAADALDLVLAPGVPRRIEVRREGRPAAAALWVKAPDRPATVTDEAGVTAVTLPDGEAAEVRVETADGWRGRYRVRVHAAPADAPADTPPHTPPDTPLRVTLQPPARVAGRVVGAEGGEPVAGALVWLLGEEGSAVVTAADGRFAYPLTGTEGVHVRAAAAGFERQHLELEPAEWPRGGDGLVLPLTPLGVVAGTVLDPAGRPLPGAAVRARVGWQREAGWSWDPADPAVESAEVDADGRFRIADLPSQAMLWLRAEAPDRPTVEVETRVGETDVRLVLGHGGSLRGRVRTADGGAVAGASAQLFAVGRGTARVGYDHGVRLGGLPAEVAEDGALRLDRAPAGTYELVVAVPGHQPLTVPGVEVADGVETDVGTLELRPEELLAGRVLDLEGSPIAGALLEVEQRHAESQSAIGHSGRRFEADDEGRFRVGGLGGDLPVTLIVRADGYLGSRLDLQLPLQEPLEVRLGRGGTVFGEVVDDTGRPLAGVALIARVEHPGQGRHVHPSASETAMATSDDDGRFELTAVPVGPVTIGVSPSGGGGRDEITVGTIDEGQRVGPLRIEVPRSGEVAGRVLRADSAPAAGAQVAAIREMPGGGSSSRSVTADALGRFRLTDLEAGPQTVVATLGFSGRAEREVEVAAGVHELELVLEPTTAVSGRIVAPDGSPVGRGRATLEREGSSVGLFVDDVGRFQLVGLDEGTYRLVAEVPGFGRGVHPEPVEVRRGQPVDGLVVRLSPGARVAGRVIGLTAADIPHLQVWSFPAAGGSSTPGLVRPDGGFEVRGLAAGSHLLQVHVRSTGQMEQLPIEVEDGALLDGVEVDLSGVTLTLTVSVLGRPLDERPWLLADGGPTGGGRRLGPGRFAFAGLEPGRYRLSIPASPAGPMLSRELEVSGDQEAAVDFEGWPVAGAALAEDGRPLPGVAVWVVEPGEEVRRWRALTPGLPPDAAGRFELPAVPPGSWRIVAGGGAWWGEALVEVPPGGLAGVAVALRPRANAE